MILEAKTCEQKDLPKPGGIVWFRGNPNNSKFVKITSNEYGHKYFIVEYTRLNGEKANATPIVIFTEEKDMLEDTKKRHELKIAQHRFDLENIEIWMNGRREQIKAISESISRELEAITDIDKQIAEKEKGSPA